QPPAALAGVGQHVARLGVFIRMFFSELPPRSGKSDRLMINATHIKAHRTAASLLKKGFTPMYRRSRGDLTSKLQVVCDGKPHRYRTIPMEGQTSDHKSAAALLEQLPSPHHLLANQHANRA
ncbi:MAG: hypothetical protein ABI216_11180, partial [Devosia sp.]